MKNFISILSLCLFCSTVSFSQDILAISSDRDFKTDGRADCVTTVFSIPVPYLRSDCQDINQPDVNITYRYKDCFGLLLGNLCDFAYSEVLVNGTLVNTIQYGGSTAATNETITPAQYAHLITDSDEACFTLKVYKSCVLTGISEIYSATKCVPVYKEGDMFSQTRLTGPIRQQLLDCQPDPSITVCCKDPAVTLSTEISFALSSSQSNTVDISFGEFSVGGDIIEIDFPTTYVNSTSLTNSWTEQISALRRLEITPEAGVCKSAALNINFLKEMTDYYAVMGCDDEIVPYLSQETGEAVFNVTFQECTLFICMQERPNIVFESIPSKDKSRNDCIGSIQATLPTDFEGELTFKWTGPSGFESNSQNLNDVPFGNYTLLITDDCCNEYEYSYFLCDDVEYGEWEQSGQELIFCRSLECASEDCEIESSEECVEPDEIIESFEEGSCIEKYYFNGQFLGQNLFAGDIKVEYDELTKQCFKIAKCKNDEYLIDQALATFGNWEFDYAQEICYRSTYCFDEIISDVIDTKIPEITEVFDLTTGLCNRTAYCSEGVPIILTPKAPVISNPWQWVEYQGCSKYVECSIGSGAETISGTESFSNWSYNKTSNYCESQVSCEYDIIPGAVHSELPTSVGIWNWSSARPLAEQCYRTVICGGTTFIEDTAQPTYQTTSISCGEGLYQYYIICDGINTGEIGCGSVQSDKEIIDTRESNEEGENIQIYPNPFSDIVYLNGLSSTKKYTVEIQNLTGQLLFKEEITKSSINLEHLPNGTYVVKLKDNKNQITIKKIIKI